MAYDYIKRMYGVDAVPGRRVFQTETKELGTILPESPTHGHCVRVQFDDGSIGLNHPRALDYDPREEA